MSLEKPNWNDTKDRKLYNELFYSKEHKKLTDKEESFVTKMYHYEEFASGLDGE